MRIFQVLLRRRDKDRDLPDIFHETDQHTGCKPCRCRFDKSSGFHFGGREFWKSTELTRPLQGVGRRNEPMSGPERLTVPKSTAVQPEVVVFRADDRLN